MESPSANQDPTALLSHSEWLKRLVRRLVQDEHEAEDVLQETWTAALANPPDPGRAARPWLGRIARNFAFLRERSKTRRRSREHRTARHELQPPGSMVEIVELQTRVSRAVLNLPEAYRTVILLRYFEDLPPREIAERLRIPVTTVKSQLRRAFSHLRERLGTEFGEEGDWKRCLLPLAGIPVSTGAKPLLVTQATGLLVMKKLALVAILLVGCVALWSEFRTPDLSSETSSLETGGSAPNDSDEDSNQAAQTQRHVPDAPDEERLAAARRRARLSDVSRPGAEGLLIGRAVDDQGVPVPNTRVTLFQHTGIHRDTTDAMGCFCLDVRLPDPASNSDSGLYLIGPRGAAAVISAQVSPWGSQPVDVGDVTLEKAADLRVRVEQGGRLIAGAHVFVKCRERDRDHYSVGRLGSHPTNADGEATWKALPSSPYEILAITPMGAWNHGLFQHDADRLEPFVLEVQEGASLNVEVVAKEDGAPISGAEVRIEQLLVNGGVTVGSRRVELFPQPRLTDSTGRTTLSSVPCDGKVRVHVIAAGFEMETRRGVEIDHGTQEVEIELTRRPPIEAEENAPTPRALTVHVEDGEGRGLPGIAVGIYDRESQRIRPAVLTGAHGTARFEQLTDSECHVSAGPLSQMVASRELEGRLVQLSSEENRFEVTLEPEREIILTIYSRGSRTLPRGLAWFVHGGSIFRSRKNVRDGRLHLHVRRPDPETRMTVSLIARGFEYEEVEVPVTTSEDRLALEVELCPVASLRVEVLAGEGQYYWLEPEVWSEERATWVTPPNSQTWIATEKGRLRFEPVSPGRYRVRDSKSKVVSDPVTVFEGGGDYDITLDLRGS